MPASTRPRLAPSLLLVTLLVTVAALATCSGSTRLSTLGQRCSLLCAPGLTCGTSGFCEKSCHCDGGPACLPATLSEGCTPDAVCIVNDSDGKGSCVVRCEAGQTCPEGEGTCIAAPDRTLSCAGRDGFAFVVPDAGAAD